MKIEHFFKPPCISSLIQAMSKYLLCARCRHPEGRVFELVVESMQFTHSVLFSENSKKVPRPWADRSVGTSGSAAAVVMTTEAHVSPHEVLMAEVSYC